MSRTVIVVGLSAASMAFIVKLRSFDQSSRVICFSAESVPPYNRCFLADVVTQEVTFDQIVLKPQDFFTKNNIEVHLATRVDRIDTDQKLVFVQDRSYGYDELFLGIGTRPHVPASFMSEDIVGVMTFHTMTDVQALEHYITTYQPKHAIVVGAGLNGLEAASSLHSRKIAVTIVEVGSHALPGLVDETVGAWTGALAKKLGVEIILGQRVEKLHYQDSSERKRITSVQLEDGSIVSADLVIVTAGSKPNSELLDGTGIKIEQGLVLVDRSMQTSVAHVYAGGDICMVPDMVTGKSLRSVTWADAMLQGLCAATSLGTTPRAYQGALGLKDSYFFGKDFYACGDIANPVYAKVVQRLDHENLACLYVHDQKLQGFVLIGDIADVPELKKKYMQQEQCF